MKDSRILCSWRPAFALTPQVCWRKPGLTLAEYARRFPGLPEEFVSHGTICINGHPISRVFWEHIRPKRPRKGRPIELTFHLPPRGGGQGGSGKQIFALVASIALSFATGFILNGGLAAKFGLGMFTAGSTAAYMAAAGVSVLGSLLIGALVPPPQARQKGARAK